MDLGLKGKVVLITASSKGIGKQCALSMAAEGARLVLCGRSQATLDETVTDVAAICGAGNVLGIRADLASSSDIDHLCTAAQEHFGTVDVLVFIGGSPRRGNIDLITEQDLLQAFQTSVLAGYRLVQNLLPAMRKQRWGRIVTIQSRAVREPIPGLLTSICTRPGVAGLFKFISDEAAGDGVLVNVIVPGRINTDRFKQGADMAATGSDNYVANKIAGIPVGRLGEPEEIANAVCFLASERASYINGASLQVDGGVIRAL